MRNDLLTALAPLGAFAIGALLVVLVGMIYGAVRMPGDPRDGIALRVVGFVISASWLATAVLALHGIR